MEATWSRATGILREKIGSQNLETWFGPALYLGVHDSRALLQLPNKFFIDWITDHYQGALLESLREVIGPELEWNRPAGEPERAGRALSPRRTA